MEKIELRAVEEVAMLQEPGVLSTIVVVARFSKLIVPTFQLRMEFPPTPINAFPATDSSCDGVVVPIPSFPFASIINAVLVANSVEEETRKSADVLFEYPAR